MTETIIRLVINVAVIVMAYIWGYREGKLKAYKAELDYNKELEKGLLDIIRETSEENTLFLNRQQDCLDAITQKVFKENA